MILNLFLSLFLMNITNIINQNQIINKEFIKKSIYIKK